MDEKHPKVYAVKHKNEVIRAASRSGGIFTALSDKIFEENGIVYGCVLTNDFFATHVRAEDEEVRNLMRGSKYIQSSLGDTFRNVKNDLEAGKRVLFSGTSCQVDGLKNFLLKEYENLFCVDIVCHGVPSPVVWKKYLEWQEHRNNNKIIAVNFRNKKDFGWHDHVETLLFADGKKVDSKVFRYLFFGHNILRPSCYECPYKSVVHPGDITIADYWGIEKAAPGFDDNKGVSLVLVNNSKGQVFFDKVEEMLYKEETKLENSMQPPLKAPFPRPIERDFFWKALFSKNFSYIAKKYGGAGLLNRVRRKIGVVKRKVLKKLK